MEQKHSKLPFSIVEHNWQHTSVMCSEEKAICLLSISSEVDDEAEPIERDANAQFILTSCNNHYSLLEALKEVVRISDRKHDAWDKAKEAIKNCEGK